MSSTSFSADSIYGDRIWSAVLALWLVSILLLGGTGFPAQSVQVYFTGSSLALICWSLWRLRNGMPSGHAVAIIVLAILSFALVFAQLVPIPYEMWKKLPGREVTVQAFDAIGQTPDYLPLSLSPSATRRAALSLLPPLAAFLAVLTVGRKHFWLISGVVVAAAIVGCLLGVVQKGLGAASGLFFYHDPGTAKFATGTFANRNFFAAQLFTSVPFLAAFAMVLAQRWQLRPLITSFFTAVYIGLLVAVLSAVGSRGGILFAMASVLLTFLLVFRPLARHQAARFSAGKGIVIFLVAIIVMAQASMVGILRLAETDPINDFRWIIAKVALQAAIAQFPAGSGFGTFVQVYQLYETPETIVDPYINHAHNEWLQLAIEGGAPAIVLMAVFVVWLAFALQKAVRLAATDPAHAHMRAAGVSAVLILLHSIVDFPLRTDAHLTFLGICVGFLALATNSMRSRASGTRSSPKSAAVERAKVAQKNAFRPVSGGFVQRRRLPLPSSPDGGQR